MLDISRSLLIFQQPAEGGVILKIKGMQNVFLDLQLQQIKIFVGNKSVHYAVFDPNLTLLSKCRGITGKWLTQPSFFKTHCIGKIYAEILIYDQTQ